MVYRTFLYNPTNPKVPKKAPCTRICKKWKQYALIHDTHACLTLTNHIKIHNLKCLNWNVNSHTPTKIVFPSDNGGFLIFNWYIKLSLSIFIYMCVKGGFYMALGDCRHVSRPCFGPHQYSVNQLWLYDVFTANCLNWSEDTNQLMLFTHLE